MADIPANDWLPQVIVLLRRAVSMPGILLHGAGGYEPLNRDGLVISLFFQDFQESDRSSVKTFL